MLIKTKELLIFERREIIGTWKYGITERKISEVLSHPQSTIHDIISTYKNHGSETSLPRTGRPSIMTERDVRHLTRILKKDRKVTLQEIHENFVSSTSTDVCERTLKNCLHEQDFYSHVS